MRPTTIGMMDMTTRHWKEWSPKVTKTWKKVKMWKWGWEWQIEKWGDSNDDGDGKNDELESKFLWHATQKNHWWIDYPQKTSIHNNDDETSN